MKSKILVFVAMLALLVPILIAPTGAAASNAGGRGTPDQIEVLSVLWNDVFIVQYAVKFGLSNAGEQAGFFVCTTLEIYSEGILIDTVGQQCDPLGVPEGAEKIGKGMILIDPQYIPWDRNGGTFRGTVDVIVATEIMNPSGKTIGQGSSLTTIPDINTDTVSGTAAAGAPIIGTVNIRGADGYTSFSAIEADGSFTVDVSALTPPFILWAEGVANGESVCVYSTIDGPGTANVTPATDLIMALALDEDPEVVYTQDPNAAAPDQDAIDEGIQTICEKLEIIYETLEIEGPCDPITEEFVGDGTGFDEVLDIVDMDIVDTDQDGTSESIQIVDKTSEEIIYEQNIITDEITIELLPDDIEGLITEAETDLDAIKAVFDKIEELYATSAPSLETLQQELRPLMADDLLDEACGPDDMIVSWANGEDGPPVGFTVDSVSIIRPMKDQVFEEVIIEEETYTFIRVGTTIEEYGDHEEGLWVAFTASVGNRSESGIVWSFVKDDDEWKLYGNRNPFMVGGDVESQAVLHKDPNDPTGTIYSGLELWTSDVGNLAQTNFGINCFIVYNNDEPQVEDMILAMHKNDDPQTSYYISSFTPSYDSVFYTEQDGLVIDDLTNPDFLFLGETFEIEQVGEIWVITITPRHIWMDRLNAPPIKGEDLVEEDFPDITDPETDTFDDLGIFNIPGEVTVSWINPPGMLTDSVALNWSDEDDWIGMSKDNPAEDDPTLDWEDWTSDIFDTTPTTVSDIIWASIIVSNSDQFNRDFETRIEVWE